MLLLPDSERVRCARGSKSRAQRLPCAAMPSPRPKLPPPSSARRWFPGYDVAAVSTVALIATAPGQTFVIAQLNVPLSSAFAIPPLTLNTAYMLATVLAAIPLVVVGRLADRLGPRRSLALVAAAFAGGCGAMAAAHGIVGVFVGFFLLRFLGQGALALVSQHALAMWFHRRLGAIQGVKQVVLFGAWVPLPLLTHTLIDAVGWRGTYALFGAAVALLVIPLALGVVRDRPEDVGLRMDDDPAPASVPHAPRDPREQFGEELPEATGAGPYPGEPDTTPRFPRAEVDDGDWTLRAALRTRSYWTLAGLFFVSPLIGTALLFDLQPILVSRGLPATAAALPVTVWTAAMAALALPAGLLADRVRPRVLIPLAGLGIAFGPLVLWQTSGVGGAMMALVGSAVGQSLGAACGSASTARYFGRTHHGAIRASLARIGVIGAGLGPLCTGISASLTEGYGAALLGFVALCGPLVLAACWLAPPRAAHATH